MRFFIVFYIKVTKVTNKYTIIHIGNEIQNDKSEENKIFYVFCI